MFTDKPHASIFQSLRIIESHMIPKRAKLQLSPEFAAGMSPAWVAEYNQWMREFFGEETVCYFMPQHGMMIARPETMAMIRNYT